MKDTGQRLTRIVAAASGLLAAALLPAGAAFADEWDFTPYITSFAPTQVEGFPPLLNEVTGTEDWQLFDLTTNHNDPSLFAGVDTQTTFGSFTNDDFLFQPSGGTNFIGYYGDPEVTFPGDGVQIDLANFGGGFENEWIDIASGPNAGTSDLLITPFGDFTLFGSFFSELSAALVGLPQ
jgi:hypothetical protein